MTEIYTVVAESLNIRLQPTTSSLSVGKLIKGEQVTVQEDWIEAGGYRWRQLLNGTWVAEASLTGESYLTKNAPTEIEVLLDEIEERLDRIRSLVKG